MTSVVLLDETLTLLRFGVPERDRPSDTIVRNARASVHSYLEVLDDSFVEPTDRDPPAPALESFRDADVPTVPDAVFDTAVADLRERRRLLLALVESDVRRWPTAARS